MQIDSAFFEENERTASADSPIIVRTGPLSVASGSELESVEIAYMTFGKLNCQRSNAILVCHALSGNANCAQWWERLIGPGKAIDTNKYFVVGVNALGGCDGSTGPSSTGPDGRPYGSRFPLITVGDMVEVQDRLRAVLGIPAWLCVCGGSMGGMQAIEWAARFPDHVRTIWATASSRAHSAMQIGFNEAARQAILRDPLWKAGDYDPEAAPQHGLSVARMIGHLSFLSEAAFEMKFGRELQDKTEFDYCFEPEFQVESYLSHQGDKFARRFDANSLLVLTRAIDYYALESFETASCDCLFTSFSSDWLYPSHQSAELHELAQSAGLKSTWLDFDAPFGHDAFLLDGTMQGKAIEGFLDESLNKYTG